MTTEKILHNLYFIVLITVTIQSLFWGIKSGFSKQRLIILYIGVSLFTESVTQLKVFSFINEDDNGLLFKFYIIFCIVYFHYFYYHIFNGALRNLLTLFSFTAIIALLMITSFTDNDFHLSLGMIFGVYYIILVVLYFYFKLYRDLERNILDDIAFWVSSGLLLWAVFFIFRIIPAQYLFKNDTESHRFLIIGNYLTSIILYLMIGTGIQKSYKPSAVNKGDKFHTTRN